MLRAVRKIELAPEEGNTEAEAALEAFQEDNKCYTIEDVDGNTVTDLQGVLYMTANSASGFKFYELISSQQDYIAARSQNWLPSYSVITMTKDYFAIDTYQVLDDGSVEPIDETFTIQKTETAGEASDNTSAEGTSKNTEETQTSDAQTETAESETASK